MRFLALAALLFLAQAAATDAKAPKTPLGTPAPADTRGVPLEGLEQISCTSCHADTVAEWATTLHGRAWVDEPYREELADARRPESCHNCHIPEPLHLQLGADGSLPQKPKARDATPHDVPVRDVDAHFGVSCETCHRGPDGTILGPWGAPTDAHVSKKHASFLPESKSALCIACHATTVGPVIGIAKDFAESSPAAAGKSCVECHMAPVERPAAVEAGKPALPARVGRSHALQTPRDPGFLARAFAVTVERRGETTVVVLANASGHKMPGRVGRIFRFEAQLLDATGAVVATAAHAIETRFSLPADGKREIVLKGVGASVRVVGTHEAPALKDDVKFIETTLVIR